IIPLDNDTEISDRTDNDNNNDGDEVTDI
ncbi:unnamed protein product, partial [Rotaria sordida]